MCEPRIPEFPLFLDRRQTKQRVLVLIHEQINHATIELTENIQASKVTIAHISFSSQIAVNDFFLPFSRGEKERYHFPDLLILLIMKCLFMKIWFSFCFCVDPWWCSTVGLKSLPLFLQFLSLLEKNSFYSRSLCFAKQELLSSLPQKVWKMNRIW